VTGGSQGGSRPFAFLVGDPAFWGRLMEPPQPRVPMDSLYGTRGLGLGLVPGVEVELSHFEEREDHEAARLPGWRVGHWQ
jgi:hypothetical protein